MTDILCNWLNNEVQLSRPIDVGNFSSEFSNGYLIGEVLDRYELQNDFDQFSQTRTADAKLNNFTRIEPVLHLLKVPFDTNTAREIMTEKYGAATRLMYQLFVALNRKSKNSLTGVAMETMRPAAEANLEGIESDMYKERLKQMIPRQTDLNLDGIVSHFHQKQLEMEANAFKDRFEAEEKHMANLQQKRQQLIEQYRDNKAKKSEMLAKIKTQAEARVNIPKPPANTSLKAKSVRRMKAKEIEAKDVIEQLDMFEERMKKVLPPSENFGEDESEQPYDILVRPAPNDEYINKIRKRLNEDASARAEREKRRRKVMVDQMKAHTAQEEAHREEMIVNRLMRQSQQERRIAVQLLQARHEKEVIRNNRLIREKQYEARRLRDFQEALDREAEMARLAKLEYIEQAEKDKKLHEQIKAKEAESKYKKHYDLCMDVMNQVTDFVCKIGEYRELTNKLLPPKLMREWTALFVNGHDLYKDEPHQDTEPEPSDAEKILEEERINLLDIGELEEFRNMYGNWEPPEDCGITGSPENNPILGHIVQRLFNMVHPPELAADLPNLPDFPVKACILGKPFSGKSSAAQKLAEANKIKILHVETLVNEAIKAHEEGERYPTPEPTPEPTPVGTPQPGESEVMQNAEAITDEQTEAQDPGVQSEQKLTEKKSASSTKISGSKSNIDNRLVEENSSDKIEDGMEKGDAEKPVTESDAPADRATERAKLGKKATVFLKQGKTIDDQLQVDIIMEAISQLDCGMGWVLDGFPTTYNQAKLLEKALSGIDEEEKSRKIKETKKSSLAPDPNPVPPPQDPPSGIDVVIVFDVADELCLRRAAGRTVAIQDNEQYQQEFKPPPEGSSTGVKGVEKVEPVLDIAHDAEQLQTRLSAWEENWSKLDKWFTKFGTLEHLDATQEKETVYLEIENLLEKIVYKKENPIKEEPEILAIDEEEKAVEPEPEPPKEEVPPPPPEPVNVEEDTVSKKSKGTKPGRSKSKSPSRSPSANKSRSRAEVKEEETDGQTAMASASKIGSKESAKSKKSSSPKSKKGKGKKTPEPEPVPEPEAPPGTPPPAPGSEAWEYVDQSLDEQLAEILCSQWESIEGNYIDSTKLVFRKLRSQREQVIRYFYQVRQHFEAYLRRPDSKQEFISQWQKDYNSLPDDMRDDEEVCTELHERVDDLRERLWSICDERKEQAEAERVETMADSWLDDRLGLMSNEYLTLIQAEVDRYQDTVRLIKDYYKGMEGKIPEELADDFSRLPLIEMPIEATKSEASIRSGSATSRKSDGSAGARPGTQLSSASRRSSRAGSGKKRKETVSEEADIPNVDEDEEEKKTVIPMIPQRVTSPEAASIAQGNKGGKDKGKGKEISKEKETPLPAVDMDEKLIFDVYQAGIAAIDKILSAEQAIREAEEEAERQRQIEKEKEKEKQAKGKKGGKKGGKSRSPSPKKDEQHLESEEEIQKKLVLERAKLEFFACIEQEAAASKVRLALIKAVSLSSVADLKNKAEETYKDMNDWLGARFLSEMESIDHLSQVMRSAIENKSKIIEELVIHQDDFLINKDILVPPFSKGIRVLRSPTPPPRPVPVEPPMEITFTVDQIINMYNQFSLVAPQGLMSVKSFIETFTDLIALTHGTEDLPEGWMNHSSDKIEQISQKISTDGEYINWRSFLLYASHPWPKPSLTELMQTLNRFKEMDQENTGYVTREQYERMSLWFPSFTKPSTPEDPNEPYPYDRLGHLKDSFFDIFSDQSSEPYTLDYVDMLLHFSAAEDAFDGFLQALSVAAGQQMPRLDKPPEKETDSRPTSNQSLHADEIPPNEALLMVGDPANEIGSTASVTLEALHKVLHFGQRKHGESHRFSVSLDPKDAFSMDRLANVFRDLGSHNNEALLFTTLMEHPTIQDIVATLKTFQFVDIGSIFSPPASSENIQTSDMASNKSASEQFS